MNNNLKILVIFSMILSFATGCSTIYFHNGNTNHIIQNSEWHHDGIMRLVEFSDPVDLNSKCNSADWTSIRTEKTFINTLASSVSFGLYDPWDVSFGCVKTAATVAPKPTRTRMGPLKKKN